MNCTQLLKMQRNNKYFTIGLHQPVNKSHKAELICFQLSEQGLNLFQRRTVGHLSTRYEKCEKRKYYTVFDAFTVVLHLVSKQKQNIIDS